MRGFSQLERGEVGLSIEINSYVDALYSKAESYEEICENKKAGKILEELIYILESNRYDADYEKLKLKNCRKNI